MIRSRLAHLAGGHWVIGSRARTFAVIAVAVCVATGAWLIPPRKRAGGSADSVAVGRRVFENLSVVPIADAAAVRGATGRSELHAAKDLTTGQVESLRDLVAEFISIRFGNRSATEYAAWRLDHGMVRRTVEEMRRSGDLGAAWRHYFGAPAPKDQSVEVMFERCFDAGNALDDGARTPVGIANGAPGVVIATAVTTATNPAVPILEGTWGPQVWVGRIVTNGIGWFRPARPIEAVLERHKRATLATVGAVMEFPDKTRLPMVFGCFWDPEAGKWTLYSIGMTNHAETRLTGWDY